MKMRKRFVIAIALSIVFQGCQSTTPATIAYRTIGSVKIAVDEGMRVWDDRVIDGKTTPAQEAQVRKAFGEYTAAARTAAAVMRAETDPAPPNLQAAADALLGLLASFGVAAGGGR